MEFRSFNHKALRNFFETDGTKGLDAAHVNRLRSMFTELKRAESLADFNAPPGWRLHELKGDREGTYSLTVSGNWRLTFKVENNEVADVDLEDYH
jgi:proteic killer suppression protein